MVSNQTFLMFMKHSRPYNYIFEYLFENNISRIVESIIGSSREESKPYEIKYLV